MFIDRIKGTLRKAADAVRSFLGKRKKSAPPVADVKTYTLHVEESPPPRASVRSQIPRSSFTKRGPGVRAKLRAALWGMNRDERLFARSKGWDRGMVDAAGDMR